MNQDSYQQMLAAVQAFHDKHRFKETGGEEMIYRVALMAEELGEIAECVTKGKTRDKLAEEVADRVIYIDQGKIVEEGEPHAIFTSPQDERTKTFLKPLLKLQHLQE